MATLRAGATFPQSPAFYLGGRHWRNPDPRRGTFNPAYGEIIQRPAASAGEVVTDMLGSNSANPQGDHRSLPRLPRLPRPWRALPP